jgi:hypothetical protein
MQCHVKPDPRCPLYEMPTASLGYARVVSQKIGGDQLVGPFATATIDLGGNCINAAAEIAGHKTYADLLEALDTRRKQS